YDTDEKSPSSLISSVLHSVSLGFFRTSQPSKDMNSSGSHSFRRRNKSLSWKDKPLERVQHFDNGYDVIREHNSPRVPNSNQGSIGNHLEAGETSFAGSTSNCDARTPCSSKKSICSLTSESIFITPDLYQFFEASLPNIVKGCQWVLLYSTARHGISLQTLFRRSASVSGPSLLITGDTKGAVFGGLIDCPLNPTPKRKYQGTSQSFVFSTVYGEPRLFRPTGYNRYFYLCMNDILALGGGSNFALSLNEDLLSGTSGPCETFGNACLAVNDEFEVKDVELWGFAHNSRYLT
ncbi:hypothetical protein M569_04766, partial [Genlisea aurea]